MLNLNDVKMIQIVFENRVVCRDEHIVKQVTAYAERQSVLPTASEELLTLYCVHLEPEGDSPEERFNLKGWSELERELHWTIEELGFNLSLVRYRRSSSPLKLSVILSTCNQPLWLERVLWGYDAQESKAFELIIADDGSRKATFEMLQHVVPQLSYSVKHVWHEDSGFRKCDILNKGILAAQTDYLLFSDGDCIPQPNFVSTHLELRRKGHFLSGGYHKLSMELSQRITNDDISQSRCFDLPWLLSNGMANSFKNNKLTATGLKRWLLNNLTPTTPSWNGHNASGWLSDILAVNGFDQRMQYGGQDREFGERLENRGVRGLQIRYSTVCLHLDHSRGYKTQDSIQKNQALRKKTRNNRVIWSPCGIFNSPEEESLAALHTQYDRYRILTQRLDEQKSCGPLSRYLLSIPVRIRERKSKNRVIKLAEASQSNLPFNPQSELIVSLTTYPARINQLHITLASMLWQTYPPRKVLVWLSNEEFPNGMADLPKPLHELASRGFEFRFEPGNIRSHKKYAYAFRDFPNEKIVTIDDDSIYPRDTLERLLKLSHRFPGAVCANTVRQIQTEGNQFTNYSRWTKFLKMEPCSSAFNVAIGCSGILYPPDLADDTLLDTEMMMALAPTADDLWLKANELRLRVPVAAGGDYFPQPIDLPNTQQGSLQKSNNGRENRNDAQWSALVNHFDLMGLFREQQP